MSSRILVIASAALALLSAPVLAVEDLSARPASEAQGVRWSSPVVLVADVDASAAWYERSLGFRRIGERVDGTSRTVLLSRGVTVISLRPLAVETTGSVAVRGPSVRADLTLLVDDVDAAVAMLQDEGVPVLSSPQDDRDGRYRLAAIADPDGNPITLREPLPSGS